MVNVNQNICCLKIVQKKNLRKIIGNDVKAKISWQPIMVKMLQKTFYSKKIMVTLF